MRIIIAGCRTFEDFDFLCAKMDNILKNVAPNTIEIVSGACRGVDELGEFYAIMNFYPIKRFPADWDVLGKKAGFIRNSEMAKYADCLVAFWDGKSKGTGMMINLANSYGLKVRVVKIP